MLVIGGGCVGAGVAWEAATRGLKVAMVERDDFAAGTSGRSTKLIHGGIRYLEAAFKNLDYEMYQLLEEALYERAHLMNAAPFMAKPLPIIIPLYTWWEIPYMWVGAKLYDLFAGTRRTVPASYVISKDEAKFQFPMIKDDGLKGAVVYYDGQHNDTRMNVLIALTACQAGAAIANYTEVQGVTHDPATGSANGALVKDVVTGKQYQIRAKGVINATGCFGDAVRKMDHPDAKPLILGAAGVHVILPDHFSPDNMGLIIPKTRDGRVLFFLPWEGMTICGTTDTPCDISMEPAPTDQDVDFIIEESQRYLNRKIRREDVKAAWSGIRPLIKDPDSAASGTAQISRKHVVEVSPTGMVSILGGKWTTYRRMAQDAIDKFAAVKHLSVEPSTTLNGQVLGADRQGVVFNKKYDRIPVTLREHYGFEKDVARHLASNYGTRALQVALVAQRDPSLNRRLTPRHPFLAAEVVFAVEQEYAVTALDVLARRTRLAFLDEEAARTVLPEVIDMMAQLLGWNAERKQQERDVTISFLNTMNSPSVHIGHQVEGKQLA